MKVLKKTDDARPSCTASSAASFTLPTMTKRVIEKTDESTPADDKEHSSKQAAAETELKQAALGFLSGYLPPTWMELLLK